MGDEESGSAKQSKLNPIKVAKNAKGSLESMGVLPKIHPVPPGTFAVLLILTAIP